MPLPKLSIITHFYNHPEMVEKQVALWKTIAPEVLNEIEFVVVDDCSEDVPTLTRGNLNLRFFRVVTDVPWNQSGSRNLGTFHARGEWALFFDIDQQINVEALAVLVANLGRLDPKVMYFLRIKELINILTNENLTHAPSTFLVNLATFKVKGMHDEDFAGHYGYEDLYVHQRWQQAGGERVLLNDMIFFEDLGFGTSNMDRDLSHNQALMLQKMSTGLKNSPGILRFEWNEIPLPE